MSSPSGILLVDKPPGPTSHDVVGRARKILGIRRIGHTGTLDPFASGLLILCVGSATRLAEYLTRLDKEYEARALLGVATTTDDKEGRVLSRDEGAKELTVGEVESALVAFRGTFPQRPPRFSAKKVGGEPAHRRARRGEDVRLSAVEVTVHELEILEWSPPEVRLRVRCSSGTYVRALARDLGESLGVGAHLAELRRTRVGDFRVDDAMTFRELSREDDARQALLPPRRAVESWPAFHATEEEAQRLVHGQFLDLEGRLRLPEGRPVAILRDQRLLAVGQVQGGTLRPRKVFSGYSA